MRARAPEVWRTSALSLSLFLSLSLSLSSALEILPLINGVYNYPHETGGKVVNN